MKEQFELKSLLVNKKIALREFLQGQNLPVSLPTGFPAALNKNMSCQPFSLAANG